MNSFGSQLQFTFAAATQQAIDLVSANRLTIGTSDEWVVLVVRSRSMGVLNDVGD
jgi:hypothetical protein